MSLEKLKEELLKIYCGKRFSSHGVERTLSRYPETRKLLKEEFEENPEVYVSEGKLVIFLMKNLEFKKCLCCGKILDFNRSFIRKTDFCSKKCLYEMKGNPFSREEVKQKIKIHSIEKYGVDHPNKNRNQYQKIVSTNLRKYGVKSTLQAESVKEKIKKSNMEKFGAENPAQSETVKKKIKSTNLIKYGGNAPVSSRMVMDKMKSTLLKNTGYESCFRNPEIFNKGISAAREKHLKESFKYIEKFSEFISPAFSYSEWKGVRDKSYDWICVKCGKIFNARFSYPRKNETVSGNMLCPDCYPRNSSDSSEESEVYDFCRKYFSEVIRGSFKVIPGRMQLDIYIPEIKLAIEYDGCWWHSLECRNRYKPFSRFYGYHLKKTEACEKQRIRLIHIQQGFTDEIKRLLVSIFENRESYPKCDEFSLDRRFYPGFLKIEGYLKSFSKPVLNIINGFHVEDCGKILFSRA